MGRRGFGGGRARRGGGSPGLAGSSATESRGYRVEGEALALKRRGAFQGPQHSRSWVRPCRIRKEMTMTGLNGEQAGASVSRRGLEVAARLAAIWCDARLVVGLADFTGRNGFAFVLGLVGRMIPCATIGAAGIARGPCRSCRGCCFRPMSPQTARGHARLLAASRYPERRRCRGHGADPDVPRHRPLFCVINLEFCSIGASDGVTLTGKFPCSCRLG